MEEIEVEKLVINLTKTNEVTPDDARAAINNIIKVFENVAIAFVEAIEIVITTVAIAWEKVKEYIRNRKKNEGVWSWNIDWDTRKKSLVISNRPKFMVRKIIH